MTLVTVVCKHPGGGSSAPWCTLCEDTGLRCEELAPGEQERCFVTALRDMIAAYARSDIKRPDPDFAYAAQRERDLQWWNTWCADLQKIGTTRRRGEP